MARDDVFIQCDLRRVNGQVDVAWLPERFAVKGKYLRLRRGAQQENGWQVVALHARRAFSEIEVKERDHLHQREASDV